MLQMYIELKKSQFLGQHGESLDLGLNEEIRKAHESHMIRRMSSRIDFNSYRGNYLFQVLQFPVFKVWRMHKQNSIWNNKCAKYRTKDSCQQCMFYFAKYSGSLIVSYLRCNLWQIANGSLRNEQSDPLLIHPMTPVQRPKCWWWKWKDDIVNRVLLKRWVKHNITTMNDLQTCTCTWLEWYRSCPWQECFIMVLSTPSRAMLHHMVNDWRRNMIGWNIIFRIESFCEWLHR